MNPLKILLINTEPVELILEDVRLNLRQPGKASFKINGTAAVNDLVTLDVGYHPTMVRYFVGWVESVNQINDDQQLIVCRELAASLDRMLPVSLRRVGMKDVLAVLGDVTGLKFRVPDADYSSRLTPHFCHVGGGYHLMDSLGDVFGVDDYIWQQQGNGEVFVGSWADSFWATRPVPIPAKILDGHFSAGSSKIPMVPRLRPGVYITGRGYLTSLQLLNGEMVLTCETALKK